MGEVQANLLEPSFNRSLKVEAKNQRITSNAGVMLLREVDDHLNLCAEIAQKIKDPRRADRIRYAIEELLRERLFALAIGCSAQDDLDRLAHYRRRGTFEDGASSLSVSEHGEFYQRKDLGSLASGHLPIMLI